MTEATYTSIITELVKVIEKITGVEACYATQPQQIDTYPAVVISPIGHGSTFLTTRDNKREYNFVIRIWGKLEETREDTQEVIMDLADLVMSTLENPTNIRLGGLLEWSQIPDGKFVFAKKEGSFYIFELTYKAIVTHNRSL